MLPPDLQRLSRIRDYCELIEATVKRFGGTYEHFAGDVDFQQSISFSILQIGELAGSLSEDVRSATGAEMNWSHIKGMRNIVAHHYGKIDFGIVWSVATDDIPKLKAFCDGQLGSAAQAAIKDEENKK